MNRREYRIIEKSGGDFPFRVQSRSPLWPFWRQRDYDNTLEAARRHYQLIKADDDKRAGEVIIHQLEASVRPFVEPLELKSIESEQEWFPYD